VMVLAQVLGQLEPREPALGDHAPGHAGLLEHREVAVDRTLREVSPPVDQFGGRDGVARASERFHEFVPVGYPTEAQRAEGRTGSAIGVHGPDARFRWLGPATVWVDWTNGCIAVSNADMVDIWLMTPDNTPIQILP